MSDLCTYAPHLIDELAAFNWWAELCRADELPAVFDARLTPSELLALLKAATVRYARDTRGWWLVAWTLPLFRGASFGLWVRQDRRQSPSGLRLILRALSDALDTYPVLINTCTDPENARKTVALGYTAIGAIPYLALDGGAATVLHLTRKAFDARWPRERYE